MPSGPDITLGLSHSLAKFFTDSPVPRTSELALGGLREEVLACQLVCRAPIFGELTLQFEGAAAAWAVARRIDLAHVEHPTYATPPDQRIGCAPGFYPDPLVPADAARMFPGQTRGIWITIRIPPDARGGRRRLGIRANFNGKSVARLAVDITVVPVQLPEQKLRVIHWFHNDCLMSHYGFDAWSPAHWRLVERYLMNAAEHGVNTITTPVFTPPLDTAVGTERPTVQLVDVTVTAPDTYAFDFSRLGRWIDLCRQCGMTHFEISHLSTQWGAGHAPKIVADVDGETRRIFGWGDASDGAPYHCFLGQFLPQLVQLLKQKNALDRSYLHVSDEPGLRHLAQYGAVREILREYAPELPVVEALSNIEFYRHGFVDRPCPATNHAQPFLDARIQHLWCYYCCGQTQDVSNRFTDFPSARNRILGWQLYKFGFEGFLHWGYNHWYDGLSDVLIDPYTNSHAGRPLPPGDGFVVYPGPDGPVDSLRWEVFREGLQDMRALRLLEALATDAKDPAVHRLLKLAAVRSLTQYPGTARWILETRTRVNAAIAGLAR